ncbi:MAG: T9SS type A sorting domain-containing protein [Chitinophagaceae bacterium]|nr:T9SS type A sorting domain-containing protein [Chitinophagaceae bacterium]
MQIKNLLNGTGTLPNYPVANNNCTIRISCRLSGILNGVVYNNSATATATGYNSQSLTDVSTNGTTPDLNTNDKPDDAGENQPTPLLVAITAQTPPCTTLSNILFTQDFGTGTGLTTAVPAPVPGAGVTVNSHGTAYTGSASQPIALNTYTVTNNALNANTADFISLTDHTGNANGRMLVINADAPASSMYSADFTAGLCSNQQYSVSFYAAFIGNSSYQTVCNGFGGFKYPKIKIRVRDAISGLIITEANSGDIFSTTWGQYGLKFTSPASYSIIIIDLINDAPGGCGNDIAIDDIQFGSCSPLPVVGLNNINAGCLGTAASFTAILSDPGVITGVPDYQWQISNDGISWSNIATAPNNATYTIASVAAGDVNKYYRALVASAGNLSNPNCVYPSPSYFLVAGCDIDDDDDGIPDLVESGGVDPLNDDDMDGVPNYRDTNYPGFTDSNSDGVNDNFDHDLDGIINELDLDSDNDGIPDVVEAGGVDTNGDGKIDNYSDTDNDGFSQNVDANNTGDAASGNGLGLPDTDGDGVPNYFDLDSDNDGIPDVVEVYGADANNDGIIDGYTDTDADGFSNNVDGDVGNDGTAENSSNALLRTGSDPDNDGRTNSYPYNNMDADSKANPYDLDSDGDGITDVTEAQFTDANFDGRVDGAINSKGRNISLAALGSLTIPNTDATGRINPYDIDSDDDGIPDNVEGLSTSSYYLPSGIDTDADGIDNTYDNYSGFGGVGIPPNDQDGDTVPDYLDSDTDGDGKIDRKEGNDLNLNGMSDDLITLTGIDTDDDGLDDRFDNNNSSAEATSARMGDAGCLAGDPTPGSVTTVQRTAISGCAVERDWRCGGYVLNCEITSFNAVLNNNITKLSWNVICKQEVDYFVIERSTDRLHFNQVAQVHRQSGLNEVSSYELTDNITAVETDIIFYRLKSVVNAQIKSTYSDIIAVKRKRINEEAVTIFPNPVSEKLQILIEAEKETQADFVIIDKTGRKVCQFKSVLKRGNNSILYQQVANLPSGLYFLHIQTGSQVINKKFTKL